MAVIRDFGWWLFANLVETTILLLLITVGFQFVIVPTIGNLLLFVLLSVISYAIKILIQVIIGTFAFYLTDISGVMNIAGQLETYLSGQAVPLNLAAVLFPITFLPWAFTYFFRVQVFLGSYTPTQNALVVVGSLAWCIILYYIASLLFKKGLKKYESVGL
jgi:ABC-2 type transport system permease protein